MDKRITHPVFSGSIECYDDYGDDTQARGKYLVYDDTGKHQWTGDFQEATEFLSEAFDRWEQGS